MQATGSDVTGALAELLTFGPVGPVGVPVRCSIDAEAANSTFAVAFDCFDNLS